MTEEKPYVAEAGDLFACWGNDWMSMAISLRTSSLRGPWELRWGPSHIAIACPRWYPHHLQPSWWESTSLCQRKCLEACREVSGVQCHHIVDRLFDYLHDGGRVRVYRLSDIDTLTAEETRRLRDMLGQCLRDGDDDGPLYDMKGALVSGTRILRKLVLWKNQLDKVFCSELVAALLQRLGRLCRENPSSFTPAQLLRRLLTDGTYQPCAELRLAPDWTLMSTSLLLPKDS